jgi:hypothetical protein
MSNYHYYKMMAHEKITEAWSAAARDRLALTATQSTREVQPCGRAPLAKLLWTLAGAFGLRRPALLEE